MRPTTILGLLAFAIRTNADIIGELIYYPDYQCTDDGTIVELGDSIINKIDTIPGSGAITLTWLHKDNFNCYVNACVAGTSCDALPTIRLVEGTCLVAAAVNVYDKFIIKCDAVA
ncbi:hypothetical protein BGZ63DRAFT_465076 [Mariannaea sp. PMI_226]|nr:hypothetical protein BGZ63DRAFT_465076 [Mariannaea sp. PMI_226]